MPTCRCYFVGALPSCIWGGKIAAMKVGFFGLKADLRGGANAWPRFGIRKGKVGSVPPRPVDRPAAQRTIAELSACRYDEYAELRS